MADLAGANAYFAKTTRNGAWVGYPVDQRTAAISEAAMMLGLLPYARQPPAINSDHATYEQAYCLLGESAASQKVAAARTSGIKSRSISDASESYASAAELEKDPGWINGVFYCPRALSWLNGYYLPGGSIRTGRVVARHGH